MLGATLVAWGTTTVQAADPSPEAGEVAPRDGHVAPQDRHVTEGSTPTEEPQVLRIVVEDHIEDATRIPGWIEERNASAREAAKAHDGWIEVRISGETYAYRIEVTAMRSGKALGPTRAPVVCECTSSELLERIDRELLRAVEELEQPVVEQETEPEPEPVGPTEAKTPTVPPDDDVEDPWPRWPLGTGAALTAVGGAGTVVGIALVAVGESSAGRGLPDASGRDLRNPAGYVTLGVAGVVLVSGITILSVDAWCKGDPSRCRRSKGAAGTSPRRRWVVGPRLPLGGSGDLGVFATGRF